MWSVFCEVELWDVFCDMARFLSIGPGGSTVAGHGGRS
jgi:hypothetical protein